MNYLEIGALKQLITHGFTGYVDSLYSQQAMRMGIGNHYYQVASNQIAKLIGNGYKILEIGPGPGLLSIEMQQKYPQAKITGLDISKTMQEIANENFNRAGIPRGKINYMLGNCEEMSFNDDSFDFVCSTYALHDYKNPSKAFKEMHRVINEKGVVLITDVRRDCTQEAFDKFLVSQTKSNFFKKFLNNNLRPVCYTCDELRELMSGIGLDNYNIESHDSYFHLMIYK